MDTEINFCPFCSAAQHKITNFQDDFFFCKECNKFFSLEQKEFHCPKCDATKIKQSDFPSPSGEIVLQCNICKKMFSAKEFFEKQK